MTRVECPACHRREAVEAITRFGRITFFCPSCNNDWTISAEVADRPNT